MKSTFLFPAFCLLAIFSCNLKDSPKTPTPQIPKASEEKNVSYNLVVKRGSEDPIENLFTQLAENEPALKDLEIQITNLANSRNDSTKAFNDYQKISEDYYRKANDHIEKIGDTLLKEKMKTLIALNRSEYQSSISNLDDIIKSIDQNNRHLYDLYEVLKITKTLPLLNTFQKENRPPAKPLSGFAIQQRNTIRYLDELFKK